MTQQMVLEVTKKSKFTVLLEAVSGGRRTVRTRIYFGFLLIKQWFS